MAKELQIGDIAPAISLSDANEQTVTLDQFKGKWVVLYFYPKDDTSGCTVEALDFTAQLPQFRKLNAQIIGVSPDPCQSHRKFIGKHDLKVLLLSDTEQKTLNDYGVWQKKSMYGKEYMGVVRTTYLIDPQGKIAHIWPKVSVNGHADAVREKIAELQK